MPTVDEEVQAKDFLKRAEIRTMKKDLLALREVDSVKERDKIVHIKTLEEQREEEAKKLEAKRASDMALRGEILQKNEKKEAIAEKDLKNYASEQERQQIFIMESQRFELQKQIDAIDKEKDPALKLEKNKLLIEKRAVEAKVNAIVEEEKKLETEQKFIVEKSQATTIPAEKKSLESRRWELDKEIQDVEKKRWEQEKQNENFDAKIKEIDKSLEQNFTEKNGLRDKVLGIDKSLREIYSGVMAREEEKRAGLAQEQIVRKAALAKQQAAENEKIQRQQWSGKVPSARRTSSNIAQVPVAPIAKNKIGQSFEAEQEQRKKFLQEVEQGSQAGSAQQKSNINIK